MIFDWYKNSQSIIENKALTITEKTNNIYLQEIYMIRFLLSSHDKNEIQNIWLSLTNGTASNFKHDPEQQIHFFEHQYHKAQSMGPLLEIKYNCDIFQEEIDYLNSLQAPLWVRQYFAGILVWYKSMRKKYIYVENSVKWNAWILNQCDQHYQYKRKSDILKKWNRDCGFPIKTYVYENKVFMNFKNITVESTQPTIKDIGVENFTDLFAFLEKETFICPKCGSKMELNSHSKRDYCLKCWNLKEKERVKKAVRAYRKKM